MKIAVFGGSGFLGSHVADQLSEAGHEVCIFDCVDSPWLSNGQEMILGDLLDEKKIMDVAEGCDVIYNFAGISDLNEAIDKPIETVKINVVGNVLLLEACKRAKVKRYIFASSVYVYSRHGGFYRCSKQSAEHFVEEFQQRYGLNYTILRYGSLYGPRSDHRNGLWRIVNHALETGKVCYAGSPESMREYIHVEDAARASVTALNEDFCNQHVVLTGHEPIRVYDLLKMIEEILGKSNSVEFIEAKNEGHYDRTPYAYQPKVGRKFVPQMHVDLGQGLLQLIYDIKQQSSIS